MGELRNGEGEGAGNPLAASAPGRCKIAVGSVPSSRSRSCRRPVLGRPKGRELEEEIQGQVGPHQDTRQDGRCPDAAPRDFDLPPAPECSACARYAAGSAPRCARGHRQERRMPVSWVGRLTMKRNPFARWWWVIATSSITPLAKPGWAIPGRERAEFQSVGCRKTSRGSQHDAAAPVFPQVLEDVDHLQPLTEGDRQRQQFLAPLVDRFGVVAEQRRQGFPHHPGHVIAVAVQLRHVPQAVRCSPCAETPPCRAT